MQARDLEAVSDYEKKEVRKDLDVLKEEALDHVHSTRKHFVLEEL